MTQDATSPWFWLAIGAALLAVIAAFSLWRLRRRTAREKVFQDQRRAELEARVLQLEEQRDEVVADTYARAEESMQSALKAAMRTLQGLGNEQQKVIASLQAKYGESQVLQDLLDIDHLNSQFSRRAQSVAVLCGGFLGRQRADALIYDVIRSAKGRIRQYRRVKIHSQSSLALVNRVVEPVALVVAELLDNATSYSAPDSPIDISIRAVPTGACVIIDDSGVGMNDAEKDRAVAMLNGRATSVTNLGNPPQFGFAVIGVLASRYGFNVSVDSTSPYGGVRAVVLLPDALLTTLPVDAESQAVDPYDNYGFPETAAPAVSAAPVAPAAPAAPRSAPLPPATPPAPSVTVGATASGLPKRRRKPVEQATDEPTVSIPRQAAPTQASPAPQAPTRSGPSIASVMGAFQQGTQAGREAAHHTQEGQNG